MPGEWGGTAEAYAASFARLCAGSVDAVLDAVGDPASAEGSRSLLDVGTGTGTLARAAAARGFDVAACDPEPSMVAYAVAAGGGVGVREAGLPELPWPDASFDVVTANFVVNHTSRPRAAVGELARVSRGVVAVTVWPRRRTVLNGLWSGMVADAGVTTPPGVALAPEEEFDRSEEGLIAVLTESGLAGVRAETLEWEFVVGTAELWTAVAAGVATVGTTYRAQDAAGRDRMARAYRRRTADLAGDDGLLRFPTYAVLGISA